jgi:hypothetical protein
MKDADFFNHITGRGTSRRFWGRKVQFIAFVRAKNRSARSPKGVGSIPIVQVSRYAAGLITSLWISQHLTTHKFNYLMTSPNINAVHIATQA